MTDLDECLVCGDEKKDTIQCHTIDCENRVCADCIEEGVCYLKEWLEGSLECNKCQQITCPFCITLCHDCANEGEDYEECCCDCAPDNFTKVECEYHDWTTCGQHTGECGECRANRNYDLRHRPY